LDRHLNPPNGALKNIPIYAHVPALDAFRSVFVVHPHPPHRDEINVDSVQVGRREVYRKRMHVAGSLELRVKFGKSQLSLLSLYNRAACRRPALVSVAIVELCCVLCKGGYHCAGRSAGAMSEGPRERGTWAASVARSRRNGRYKLWNVHRRQPQGVGPCESPRHCSG